MKTKHQTLRDNNIEIDRLNEDKPMLVNGILKAMVEYAQAYHEYKLANGVQASDEQALPIQNVSERSWHIGEKVVVTHCIYGHEFENGVTVEIVDHDPTVTTSWLCSDGKNSWWLSEDEGYVR